MNILNLTQIKMYSNEFVLYLKYLYENIKMYVIVNKNSQNLLSHLKQIVKILKHIENNN